MSTSEYDKIAEKYSRSNLERDDRACVFIPTAKHYLGDIRNAIVFDFACGDGFFSRLMKSWGAREVVAVDISEQMIGLAREKGKVEKQGIHYHVGNAATATFLGTCDIVFAAFLLHYAESVEELKAMCDNIAQHLRPGGRIVAFNENPFAPIYSGVKYNVEAKALGPVCDGSKLQKIHYRNGKEDFSFTHNHFEPATYDTALKTAGFKNIQWLPFVMEDEIRQKFPVGYWDEYLGEFSIKVLVAEK